MAAHRSVVPVAAAAALAAACAGEATAPSPRLALSAASRSVSVREDSSRVFTDSARVAISGSDSLTAQWFATAAVAEWITLTSAEGTGSGMLRWTRDGTGLFPGTYVDTITVALRSSDGARAELIDTLVIGDVPAQYTSVRRAWRPGERDSLLAFILRTGAWGMYSDLASIAVPKWDSVVDVVGPPARNARVRGAGPRPAPQFESGWGTAGIDLRIVYDSIPGGAIQEDSIDWVMTFWWNPADSTWKGFIVRATANSTFNYANVNTVDFDASDGTRGVGGGESRLADTTDWRADDGRYRISYNGGYGGLDTVEAGPFTGGNVRTGQMGGRLDSIIMNRTGGSSPPAVDTFTYAFGGVRIYSQRVFCYYAPVAPPTGYSQCTGPAFAALVAAARAGRPLAAFTDRGAGGRSAVVLSREGRPRSPRPSVPPGPALRAAKRRRRRSPARTPAGRRSAAQVEGRQGPGVA